MSLAADARFRSVRVAWTNVDANGGELVQLFAKPALGAWLPVGIFALVTGDQVAQWDTALPVTAYDIAMRFLNGTVPTVGYEGGNPDLWTAPTASLSKSTVTATSADVAWVSGVFLGADMPVSLIWTSVQQSVPFLLEKSTDGGMTWTTVAADLVAQSYLYTVLTPEVGTTVKFRVTAQRGAVAGPTAGVLDVLMMIVVGTPVITTHTFSDVTAVVSLAWSAASAALQYLVEKSDDTGVHWNTAATVAGLSYDYPITPAEANHTVRFRVTGQNGAVFGTPSPTVDVVCTMTIGVGSVDSLMSSPCTLSGLPQRLSGANTPPSGAVVSNQVECSVDGTVVETVTIGPVATSFVTSCFSASNLVGHTGSARIRGVGSGGVFGVWSAPYTVVL